MSFKNYSTHHSFSQTHLEPESPPNSRPKKLTKQKKQVLQQQRRHTSESDDEVGFALHEPDFYSITDPTHFQEEEATLEQENLIQTPEDVEEGTATQAKTPLPKVKMFLISLAILAEAFSYSLLTPFLPEMVKDFKIASSEEQAGYFVGMLVSSVSFAQLISGAVWGKLSDKFGRKPVLLIGLAGNTICLISFGFCKSYWVALVTRVIEGLLNGIIPAYKSYIFDSTDSTNQERGFVIVGVVWGLSTIIAPAFGGWLAPARKFNFLRQYQIIQQYPYLLAVGVAALINFIVFFTTMCLLAESNPNVLKKRRRRKVKKQPKENKAEEAKEEAEDVEETEKSSLMGAKNEKSSYYSISGDTSIQGDMENGYYEKNPSKLKTLIKKIRSIWFFDPTVIKVLMLYSQLAFILSMFDEIFPIWASNNKSIGGLDWDPATIGIVMAVSGVASLVTLVIYPIMVAKMGILKPYQFACFVLLVVGLAFPFNSDLSKYAPQWVVYITVALGVLGRTCCGEVCYTSQYIIMSNSVHPDKNGAMNGLAQTLGSLGWALGPLVGGAVLSWTLGLFVPGDTSWKSYIPWEKTVFLVMALFSLTTFGLSLIVPKDIETRKSEEEDQ